jgi:hexosaminidase
MTACPQPIVSCIAQSCLLPVFVLSLLAAPVGAQPSQPPAPAFVNTLMPLPSTLESKPGTLRIDPSFSYTLHGDAGPRLGDAAVRFIRRLETRTGVSLAKSPAATGQQPTLTVDVATATEDPVPQPDIDETYTLDIDPTHIALHAKTDIGALHGMETLLQLIQPSGAAYIFPALHIEDAPRFPWRGLMLDPGRHFLPVANILRTLDAMAAVKLNVLHWHLTEDQGFRIESRVFPKLTELGSNGQFYTQQQVREVITYASARGIRVVPEFDMPGHIQSWLVGYPELGSAPGPFTIADKFGVMDAAFDPTRESTFQFIDAFLGEMAALFPDPYMHIGGDESNGKQWRANPQIQAFMQAHGFTTTVEFQSYFSTRVQQILAGHHKQMVGWDEILSPTLPRDAVIQNWHGIEFLIDGAKQGHRGFLSHPYYLDHLYSAADMFLADPLPANSDLTPDQAKLILGGEVCMWGEQVIPSTIDSRIWPRTAAVAERFWSPAADRDSDDMYRRLSVESLRLEAEGLMHMSGPVRVMRNLAGSTQIQPLELFVSTLQPVDFHIRSREQRSSPATVLDRLVDSVRPDPPLRHDMPILVDAAIQGDAASASRLDALFNSWVTAAPALEKLEANSPILQEASAHIAAWPKLGSMGIEALSYLRSGSAPPPGWQDAQNAILHDAVNPHELVDFVVLAPLQKLVEAAAQKSQPAQPDPIHSYLQPLVNNHTVAGAVTLVATKDHIVYFQPVGFRDRDTKANMTADSLFWIASVSKPLTATALMMLVDEGKVNLNDPVEKYLPEFKGQQVYRTRPDPKLSTPNPPKPSDLIPADHPILVREILSHTSGLPFKSAAQPGALDLLPLSEAVHTYAAEPLLFQPFTAYSYANEGLNTAARIIEVVSGMPYEQFMQQRLFSPLGMSDTTFWPTAEQAARIASSYKLSTQTGDLEKMNIDQLTYPLTDRAHRYPMPAGGLFSTAADLEKFCRMILNGGTLDGKRYISEQALHMMTNSQNGSLGGTDYGFGWAVANGTFGHGGAYKNAIDVDPAAGRILVFMVQQSGPWGTPDGDAILPTLKRLANQAVASPASTH